MLTDAETWSKIIKQNGSRTQKPYIPIRDSNLWRPRCWCRFPRGDSLAFRCIAAQHILLDIPHRFAHRRISQTHILAPMVSAFRVRPDHTPDCTHLLHSFWCQFRISRALFRVSNPHNHGRLTREYPYLHFPARRRSHARQNTPFLTGEAFLDHTHHKYTLTYGLQPPDRFFLAVIENEIYNGAVYYP